MSFVVVKKIRVIRKRGTFLEGLPKVKQQKVKLSRPTAISKNVNLIPLKFVTC